MNHTVDINKSGKHAKTGSACKLLCTSLHLSNLVEMTVTNGNVARDTYVALYVSETRNSHSCFPSPQHLPRPIPLPLRTEVTHPPYPVYLSTTLPSPPLTTVPSERISWAKLSLPIHHTGTRRDNNKNTWSCFEPPIIIEKSIEWRSSLYITFVDL